MRNLRLAGGALVCAGVILASLPFAADDLEAHSVDAPSLRSSVPGWVGKPHTGKGEGAPLSRYLNEDGSLNLPPEGISGSINPEGFRLASTPGEAPRFEPVSPGPRDADDHWDSRFSLRGTNGIVRALAWDGVSLYAGGSFTVAGTANVSHIARWDGTAWCTLGAGIDTEGTITALAWDGKNLYAGGSFSRAGEVPAANIARWDGASWSALGSGTNGTVNALAWDGTNLYAGGGFTTAGDAPAKRMARWDGGAWSALGDGMTCTGIRPCEVDALLWCGTGLYAGGAFERAGDVSAPSIARWDGSVWSPVGTGMSGGSYGAYVYALAWDGATLFAGGDFTRAGDGQANFVAKWDGTNWSPLGEGTNYIVRALAWDGTGLHAGGNFDRAGNVAASHVARWSGAAWSALGSGVKDTYDGAGVYALSWGGGGIYAGGIFELAGEGVAGNTARWTGSEWTPLPATGEGLHGGGYITSMVVGGNELFAGGAFETIGGSVVTSLARWDGTAWGALGAGLGPESSVQALAWDGSNLWAAGRFTMPGRLAPRAVAKWDGTKWDYLESEFDGYVYALAWDGTNLYAGGSFGQVEGQAIKNIAKWDGSKWSPLGLGIDDGVVWALAWDGQNLFAGGQFSKAGNASANGVAKWDGTAWRALGTGVTGYINALALDGANLFVGGGFTKAGGERAYCVARWDGTKWSPLGEGITGDWTTSGVVKALSWDGTNLYAAGSFTKAGGVEAPSIAKWDGMAWSLLGSGVTWRSSVSALAWHGHGPSRGLFAGGDFVTAGNKLSCHVARWSPCALTCEATGPALGLTGAVLHFQSVATPDGCTGTPSIAWDFGDGGTSGEQNPSHAYTGVGTFAWTMTAVADAETCSKNGIITIYAAGDLPGDCDQDGQVSIGEVQKAINMFLGLEPVGCGVDRNTDGAVSIGEVQKVINAFLGLPSSC